MCKTLFIFFALVTMLHQPALCNNDDSQSEIQKIIQGSSQAFAERDIEKWSSYFVQDESFTHIGFEQLTTGFGNLRNTISSFFETVTFLDANVSNIKVYVAGDVAWASYENHWAAKRNSSNKTLSVDGYTTLGLIKQNGKWLILRYHETAKE